MKFALFLQDETSASAYYRAIFPFQHLQGFEAVFMETREQTPAAQTTAAYSRMYMLDGCFFMRPHDVTHVEVLEAFKKMQKKIWIDYDDNLFQIPYDHKEWEYFQLDSTKRAILHACRLADVITVSTQPIKDELVKRQVEAEKIHVIPNAINDYLYPEPTAHNEVHSDYIAWRGAWTHDRDLETIGPAVAVLMKKNFRFVFMGHRPYAIEKYLTPGQFSTLPLMGIFSYFERLKALNAPMHIVALAKNELNRAKSNIAFLEAAWIGGSLVFAPKEYSGIGENVAYENPDELVEKIQVSAKQSGGRGVDLALCHGHIRENFLLSKVNKLRTDILNNLFYRIHPDLIFHIAPPMDQ